MTMDNGGQIRFNQKYFNDHYWMINLTNNEPITEKNDPLIKN